MECVNTYQLNRHIEELDKIEREDSWVESFREPFIEDLLSKGEVVLRNGERVDVTLITDAIEIEFFQYANKAFNSSFAGVKAAALNRASDLWQATCNKVIAPYLSEYAQTQEEKMEIGV